MKQCEIKLTAKALADMESIYDYIANNLQAPNTSTKQYERIADGIQSLDFFPERCRSFDSQPKHDMGLRQLPIDDYSVIHVAEEDTVTVLRVLCSASDILNRLRFQ